MRNMRNEGEKYLDKVKVKANEKDIHIKTEIISSKDISGGILDFAEENNIDLIVIGNLQAYLLRLRTRISFATTDRYKTLYLEFVTNQGFRHILSYIHQLR
jgi:nucleotide-binding universal stress UspA family protein